MALYKQATINAQKGGNASFASLGVTDGGFVLSNPLFVIDTNFDIKCTNAFDIVTGGIIKTVAADTSWDTGTAKDITINYWAAALLSIAADGSTTYLQWGTEATTEAAAIAQLDGITPTGAVVCGYATVKTKTDVNWVAGTDALQGGTGGDVSSDTNYYNVFGWVK